MGDSDWFRKDGRTFGFVSLNRTFCTSVIEMKGGYISFKDFPEKVWHNGFINIPKNKDMYFLIGLSKANEWRLIDYF